MAKIRLDDTDDPIDICLDNVFKAVFTRNTPESQGALSRLLSALIGQELTVTGIVFRHQLTNMIYLRQEAALRQYAESIDTELQSISIIVSSLIHNKALQNYTRELTASRSRRYFYSSEIERILNTHLLLSRELAGFYISFTDDSPPVVMRNYSKIELSPGDIRNLTEMAAASPGQIVFPDALSFSSGAAGRQIVSFAVAPPLETTGWTIMEAVNIRSFTRQVNNILYVLYIAISLIVLLFIRYNSFFFARILGPLLEEIKNEQTERLKCEIEALRYQANPHFLGNALNSVRMMAIITKNDAILCAKRNKLLRPYFPKTEVLGKPLLTELKFFAIFIKRCRMHV